MFKTLLGRKSEEEKIVADKREEGHQIRNQATKDIIGVQKDIDKLKVHNSKELDKINKKLQNLITYNLAVATGGFKKDGSTSKQFRNRNRSTT